MKILVILMTMILSKDHGSHNSDEEPNNIDDIKAWDTANKHLFCVYG